MLYWIFTAYRQHVALIAAPILAISAGLLTLVAVFVLSRPGGRNRHETSLIACTLAAVMGAAMHLALLVVGQQAVSPAVLPHSGFIVEWLVGPAEFDHFRLVMGAAQLGLVGLAAVAIMYHQIQEGGGLHEVARRLRDPLRRRDELGSAHFCYPNDFARLQKSKGNYEVRLLGDFYGKRGPHEPPDRFARLDRGPGHLRAKPGIAFSVEDQARGLCLIGPSGTGKSQAGILPLAADAMQAGQSLIVLDPQNELLPYLQNYSRVTGHRLLTHDPTDPALSRFNLAHGVQNVSDAQAVASVLVGGAEGDFWSSSARNLLAGCLLRFESLGDILSAFDDLIALANRLMEKNDGAANVSRAFAASVKAGDRSAPGILATLQASTLSAWAEETVRSATAATDFTARMLVETPTLLVLKCPGKYMRVYGPYLGAVLQRLILDLDSLGEQTPGGALVRPVKVIIDEFPVIGRVGGLVETVNLLRKRHISMVIAAQTLAQFELVYGRTGAEALISGLATQIYFGSCDAATARFVSASLGKTTERVRQPGQKVGGAAHDPQLRQRDLMSIEEVITPPEGNCTIIHRYSTTTYATQVVLLASLTYMFERRDWQVAIAHPTGREAQPMDQPLFKRPTVMTSFETGGNDRKVKREGY